MLTAVTLVFAILCKQAAPSLSPNPQSKSPQKVLFKTALVFEGDDPENKMKEKKPFYSFVVAFQIIKTANRLLECRFTDEGFAMPYI